MDFNVKMKTVHINETIYENSAEHPIDSDVTMPDYCPDIKRILKCTVTPGLISARCAGDRVNVEANALVQIMYTNEENEIYCFDKTFPFSKSVDIGTQTENPVVQVNLKTSYANARAVSSRRIDVHSSVSVNIKVTAKHEEQIVLEAENSSLQLLKNCKNVSDFVGEAVKNFTLSETLDLGDNKNPVFQILRITSDVVQGETKAINNKLLIKGEVLVNVLYCSDNNEHTPEVVQHTMPVSQIIELDGISEETNNCVKLSVCSVEVVPKGNSSGEKRLLEINANVVASVYCEMPVAESLPTDCYSTHCNINSTKKLINLESILCTKEDTTLLKKTEEMNSIKVARIYDIWCEGLNSTSSIKDGELKICGSVNVCILGKDEENVPFYAERTVDFEKVLPVDAEENTSYRVETQISPYNVGFILGGENGIDLRIELSIKAQIYSVSSVQLISSVEEDTESTVVKKTPALTVYFANEGEKLWDIARKYNTTMNLICDENDLKDIEKVGKCKLFIPGM